MSLGSFQRLEALRSTLIRTLADDTIIRMIPAPAQTIRIGHSPDPDDAFMFYAMTQGRIPLMGFRVDHCLEDI